jgi:hypothetical protein
MFDSVSILFSDVVSFTEICSRITPMEVVSMLNGMYSLFDTLTERNHVYKVRTHGPLAQTQLRTLSSFHSLLGALYSLAATRLVPLLAPPPSPHRKPPNTGPSIIFACPLFLSSKAPSARAPREEIFKENTDERDASNQRALLTLKLILLKLVQITPT